MWKKKFNLNSERLENQPRYGNEMGEVREVIFGAHCIVVASLCAAKWSAIIHDQVVSEHAVSHTAYQ